MDQNDDLSDLLADLDDGNIPLGDGLEGLDEAGVDLAEIARSLLPGNNDDGSNGFHDGMLVAPPEPELPDFDALEVVTARHAVHQVLPDAVGITEYIVSNLRKFEVEMHLLVKHDESFSLRQLRLKATVVYENGMPVRCSEGEALLIGNTTVTTVNGVACFKLQLGKRALSMHHDKQKFRIRIAPEDPELAAAYPCLVCLNEPFKSVTKLIRSGQGHPTPRANPPRPAPTSLPNYGGAGGVGMMGGGGGGGGDVSATSIVPPAAVPPLLGAVSGVGVPAARAASSSTSGASGALNFDASAIRAAAAAASSGSPLRSPSNGTGNGGGGGGGFSFAALQAAANAPPPPALNGNGGASSARATGHGGGGSSSGTGGGGDVSHLERDLERERNEREALMQIMQQQKAQIDQMAQNNALVMAELERFRRSDASTGSG